MNIVVNNKPNTLLHWTQNNMHTLENNIIELTEGLCKSEIFNLLQRKNISSASYEKYCVKLDYW